MHKHSNNISCDLLKVRYPNSKFSGLSLSEITEQTGVQVLIRIDTPIEKISKIEAPSPTLSKKLKNRKAKFKLIPDENAVPKRSSSQDEKFKIELTESERKRLFFRKYIRSTTKQVKVKRRNNSVI